MACSEYFPGTFVADNVDHSAATLDGRGSLHGMGIIAVLTLHNAIPLSTKLQVVIYRQQHIKTDELVREFM